MVPVIKWARLRVLVAVRQDMPRIVQAIVSSIPEKAWGWSLLAVRRA